MSDAPHKELEAKKTVVTKQPTSAHPEREIASREQQIAFWEGELLSARSEAVIDGRSDWAAERYASFLEAALPDEKLLARALDGLAELAETREGRVARRILADHYRRLGETSSVTQLQSLSLRIGTRNERICVLRDRVIETYRHRGSEQDPLTWALSGVDTRRTTLDEHGRALLLAYNQLKSDPDALALIPRAVEALKNAEPPHSVIDHQLLFLEKTDDAHGPISQMFLQEVLAALGEQNPRQLLERAFHISGFPELRSRAALLLDLQDRPVAHPSLQNPSTLRRAPLLPADIELGTRSPEANVDGQPKLELEVTSARDKPARFRPEDLQELEVAASARPDDREPLYILARAYRELEQQKDELRALGRLAGLLTESSARNELADLYRRSSELLLTLGDTTDALRIRVESAFLSSLREEDEQFVLSHCGVKELGDTLAVIRRILEHSDGEREVQLAYLAAQLLLTLNDDTDAAWLQIFRSWRRYPNDHAAANLIFHLGADPRRAPAFHDAVMSLASDGAFRDPTLLKRLISLAKQLGHDECLILLKVNAAAASPLDPDARRKLVAALKIRGRSRATGYRQVLALVHDVQARRAWTNHATLALEEERRFTEAADELFKLYELDTSDDEHLIRAFMNLERDNQWERIIKRIDEELTRPRSVSSLLTGLRYLERVERMNDFKESHALNAAIRTALLFPKEPALDAHARALLALEDCIEKLASYLEKRSRRLGDHPQASELLVEAVDLLAGQPVPDIERLQRLRTKARRAGVEIRHLDDQPRHQNTPTNGAPISSLLPPEHASDTSWHTLVEAPPTQRAVSIGRFLGIESLRALSNAELGAPTAPNAALVQQTAKELMGLYHQSALQIHEHQALRQFHAWSLPTLLDETRSFLNRVSGDEPIAADLREALGDPMDAVRIESISAVVPTGAICRPLSPPVLIGFNSTHALTSYVLNRLPRLYDIVDASKAVDKDELKERLSVAPWALAIYGSGSVLSSYRSLLLHLGLSRALTLDELITQLAEQPLVALLFAEWAFFSQP